MNPLGLEMLTLLGMPPVEYIKLASDLGCAEVSTGLSGLPLTMFGISDFAPYPMWSLKDDAALRRDGGHLARGHQHQLVRLLVDQEDGEHFVVHHTVDYLGHVIAQGGEF